jgi:aspartyl-tRNA(Asn)/glutamyl-tRNA(Gln) amidotransferase subunit A
MHEDLHLLQAHQIRTLFCRGDITAAKIALHFLDRIKRLDTSLGSFLEVFDEQVLKDATLLDEKRQQGKELGILAAVPVALKDNIHFKGTKTTCASAFLKNYKALFHSTVTDLILKEDALIIGKTNMDEFAMGSSTEKSAFQKTKNPWDLSCVPGGSSGGSAAAVSARLVPISFGSDTGGSIRQPASFCGIVGFKPTYGRVSRYGLVAFGSSLDQIGPMTTTTEDTALVMEVIARHCDKDSTSLAVEKENFLENLHLGIKGMKIGVPFDFIKDMQQESKDNFLESIEQLKRLGAEIIDIDLSILKHSIAVYYILATAEASTNLARFDGIRYGVRSKEANTLQDVYELSRKEGFGKEVKRRILLGTFVLSSGFKDAYYKKAQKVRKLMIDTFLETFKKCKLIAMPVCPSPAFKMNAIQDPIEMYLADMFTIGANLAGLPAISIPSGFSKDNKPFGLQLIGRQLDDALVLRAAQAFETQGSFIQVPKGY